MQHEIGIKLSASGATQASASLQQVQGSHRALVRGSAARAVGEMICKACNT